MREGKSWRDGRRLFESEPRAEVGEELAFHLEERIREYQAMGMDREAARAAALERFGDMEGVRRECAQLLAEERRAETRRGWLSDIGQDVGFGVRAATRAPLFSLLAIVTLALGIGANAAVFGVVKSVLLESLPYADAGRLVRVYGHFVDASQERGPLSAGTVRDIAERQRSFVRVAALTGQTLEAVYASDAGPEVVRVAWIEPELLPTLGVQPALGRNLVPEDSPGDTALAVMLPHATWQLRFGGDVGVIGRSVWINGIPRTLVGVLPRDFVSPVEDADFYYPLNLDPVMRDAIAARGSHWLALVGRLAPGVELETVRAELSGIAEELARAHPRDNAGIRLMVVPLRDTMVGDTRTPLLMLMASAALVLLIACANLAGGLLSRALSRRREFAVRVSLGAGPGRLIRQLLTESTLLALFGGAAGLLLAATALRALDALALPSFPPYAELSLDAVAVGVTFVLTLLTGLAFGLAPALAVSGVDPQRTLREESRGAGEGRQSSTLRGLLVAAQVALCLSLLAGAGLLGRSLWAMASAPLGFDPERTLAITVPLSAQRYGSQETRVGFQEQFGQRLRALPGVRDVAVTNFLPTRVLNSNGLTIVGAPWPAGEPPPFILTMAVSDDYFRTLRIPLRSGRTFEPRDHADAPGVVVISETMARRFWPGGDAIGARIRLGPDPNSQPFEVIGVVADVRNDLARPDAEPMVYPSIRQWAWGNTFVLRTTVDPLGVVPAIRSELASLDPMLPVHDVTTLDAVVGDALAARRLPLLLMISFGVLALLLAALGVYAMFAALAAAREREFGVRMALGSTRSAIATLVVRQGVAWLALGLAAGGAGIAVVARALEELLYGVHPLDPLALGGAVATLTACATLALLGPIRRATRVDPITVLR